MPDLTNWLLVFVRASALLAIFPLFSATNVPIHVRIGLGAFGSFLVAPLLPAIPVGSLSLWALIHLIFIEASVGLLLGFVSRMVFYAIEFAGGIISTEMGLMLSANFNPAANTTMAAPGMILHWLALMLLLSLNLHHWMLVGFQQSYTLVPVGGAHLSEGLLMDIIGRTGMTFRIALQITAPIMAISFVITLVFSVLSRAVPQMNVFSESFPVRTLAGLTVFGLTCNLMAQHIQNFLQRLPEDVMHVAQLLGTG